MRVGFWLGLALLAGCATVEHPTASRTVRSLRETQAQALAARDQMEGTIQLLDELIKSPQADIRPLHQRLVKEIKAIEVEADRAGRAAAQYREYAFQYEVTWTLDLKNTDDPELHRLRSRTQETAREHFRAVEEAATVVRTGYWSVLENMRGIVQHLGQDLTAPGVEAVQPLYAKTAEEAIHLRACLDEFIATLDEAVAALSPKAAERSVGGGST